MDISFNCPHCSQHLAVDESGAGTTVNCPGCNQQIEIPRIGTPPPLPAVPVSISARTKTRPCPACHHEVSLSARTCPNLQPHPVARRSYSFRLRARLPHRGHRAPRSLGHPYRPRNHLRSRLNLAEEMKHAYKIRPRKDKRGVDLLPGCAANRSNAGLSTCSVFRQTVLRWPLRA